MAQFSKFTTLSVLFYAASGSSFTVLSKRIISSHEAGSLWEWIYMKPSLEEQDIVGFTSCIGWKTKNPQGANDKRGRQLEYVSSEEKDKAMQTETV